jgi:hypothetical protein
MRRSTKFIRRGELALRFVLSCLQRHYENTVSLNMHYVYLKKYFLTCSLIELVQPPRHKTNTVKGQSCDTMEA